MFLDAFKFYFMEILNSRTLLLQGNGNEKAIKNSGLGKNLLRQIFLMVVFIVLSNLVSATVYYVSTTGNDANSGTSTSNPWRTLTKVNNFTPKPGDQILFKRGDSWTGTITIKSSGTSASPITYGAYGTGVNPVISGFTTVTGWTNEGGGIYSKLINPNSSPNLLTINGVQFAIGRHPNNSNLVYESASTNKSITDKELTGTLNWTGAEAVIYKNIWTVDRCVITNHTGGTLTYTNLGTTRNATAGEQYFIQNHIRTLDQFGEWYYNKSTKKLSVFFGTVNPTTKITKISVIDNLLTNSTRDYIVISNLAFEGSNNSTIKFLSGTDNCVLKNCKISFSGYDAFTLSGNKITVDNCSVSNVNGGGIVVNGLNALITNNSLSDIGVIPGQSNMIISTIGITMTGNYPTVKYNTIDSTAYMGIYFTPSAVKGVIQYNKLNGTGQLRHDAGSIYLGHDHPGTLVDHNIISKPGGNGIYLDEYCTGVTVSNNTVFAAEDSGIKIHRSSSNNIKNNTLYDNAIGINFTNWSTEKTLYSNIVSDNISVAKPNQYVARIVNRYTGDNNFGTASGNYYVRPLNSDKAFQVNVVGSNSYTTLSVWRATTKTDLTSTDKPYNDNVEFYYNETSVAKIIILNYPMINVKGTKYSSNVTLQPYTSAILMKDPSPVLSDLIKPVINGFSVPSTSTSLVVAVSSFTASDNKAVTGYKLTENSASPLVGDTGWSATKPVSHTFSSEGTKTLYAWVKDAAGNISPSVSDQVIIALSGSDNYSVGNTIVYNLVNSVSQRRAMPFTFSENGDIQSISIYHNGGTGNMLLGVYADNSGKPGSLLGVTSSTAVNTSQGWQTVTLSSPVSAKSGQTVWLAWIFQNSVGVRFTTGSPGRAQSGASWSAGMPASFGTSTIGTTKFSIYCTYSKQIESPVVTNNLGNTDIYNLVNAAYWRRAMPFTFSENGDIQSISIYHNGGTGNMLLGVYADNSGKPGSLLGVTSSTAVNTSQGWQTVTLSSPVSAKSGQTVWLAWVFQNSVGVRFTTGSPGRAQSGASWSAGMPASFGTSTIGTNKFSIYCTYKANTTLLKEATISENINNNSLQAHSVENDIKSANNSSVEISVNSLESNDFKLYPNPANSFVNVDYEFLPENGIIIEIMDINGKKVHSQTAQQTSNRLDINHLKSGLYIIRSTNGKRVDVKKLIVE
jgi:parallel beta-helix repeat protein